MLVLFSIAMFCFFALFGMVLVLLRQAKAEGALLRQQDVKDRAAARSRQTGHASDTHARFGVSQAGLDLTLSNLVPSKQPDWRFMVREGGRGPRFDIPSDRAESASSRGLKPLDVGLNRADRAFANKDLGDLTDPQSSQSNIARRA